MNANPSPRPEDHNGREAGERVELASPNRVLQVAESLFLTKGYTATTIREIAAASKVSNATIVKYFGGKPELFACIVSEFGTRLLGAAVIDFLDLPEQGLKAWGAAVLRLLLEPRMVVAVQHLYSDVAILPMLARTHYEMGPAKLAASLGEQLKRWAEVGQFPDQDFFVAAEWFMHLLGGGVYHRVMIGLQATASDAEIEESVGEATRIFLAAFGQSRADR